MAAGFLAWNVQRFHGMWGHFPMGLQPFFCWKDQNVVVNLHARLDLLSGCLLYKASPAAKLICKTVIFELRHKALCICYFAVLHSTIFTFGLWTCGLSAGCGLFLVDVIVQLF